MFRISLLKKPAINKVFRKTYINPVQSAEYDYVIVGAGSAGCALAHYLAEADNKVALIESGPNYHTKTFKAPYIKIPMCLGFNMHDHKINTSYYTVPQEHMHKRKLYCPRGHLVGGSSAINGMVYVRGHPKDFDRWAEEGAEGWDFSHVLPYFKKAENCKFNSDDKYRGKSGPLGLTRANEDLNKLSHTFFKSCESFGLPRTEDFNGISQYGYGLYDRTIEDGVRNDAYRSFILKHPQIAKNITLIHDRKVLRVYLEGNTAKGVYMRDAVVPIQEHISYARKEVILCAGAIDSPKILLLSGIGNDRDLSSIDIKTKHHLPGVGSNLQDHLEFYIQHKAKGNDTLHNLATNYFDQAVAFSKYLKDRSGPLSASHLDAGAFLSTDSSVPHPDIQIHFFPYGVIEHALKMPQFPMFQIHIGTLRAHSRGSVKLYDGFHGNAPIIDFKYLSDERDVYDLVKCLDIGREILNQPAFKEVSEGEVQPGPKHKSLDEKIEFIRYHAESAYHPSCTCKIGRDSDEMAVLDSQLKVRGIKNLRVADASSFPSITSGNLNAVVIMLATRAADLILGKPTLPPINVPYK